MKPIVKKYLWFWLIVLVAAVLCGFISESLPYTGSGEEGGRDVILVGSVIIILAIFFLIIWGLVLLNRFAKSMRSSMKYRWAWLILIGFTVLSFGIKALAEHNSFVKLLTLANGLFISLGILALVAWGMVFVTRPLADKIESKASKEEEI